MPFDTVKDSMWGAPAGRRFTITVKELNFGRALFAGPWSVAGWSVTTVF